MERKITLEDCRNLRKAFEKYCETAEQHQFGILFLIDVKMNKTLSKLEKLNEIPDEMQDEISSMFRVVTKATGITILN